MSAWDWNRLTTDQRLALWRREQRTAAARTWALAWAQGAA